MQIQHSQKFSAETPLWQQMTETRRNAGWNSQGPQIGEAAVLALLSSMLPSAEGAMWLEEQSKKAWENR